VSDFVQDPANKATALALSDKDTAPVAIEVDDSKLIQLQTVSALSVIPGCAKFALSITAGLRFLLRLPLLILLSVYLL